jgi:argininosuccinate lyase
MKREILKKALLMLPLLGIMGGAYFPEPAEAAEPWPPRDNFYWLGQINKASDIINTDEKLLTKEEGRRFAAAIQKVLDDGNKKGAERPTVVITFEPFLIKAGGPDITKIHAGRSSQDMLTTVSILMQREQLLELSAALNKMTATLLNLARAHEGTLIPNYTNGVQAQPNSLGHFLLAYVNAYERDHDRIQEYYKRLNRSPMGATVLNGTGWPLNRDRMAAYLGFDGLAYNTYDAGQVFPQEAPIEMGGIASSIAIHTTSLIQEIMQQYAQPRPWILLQEGNGNTYVSSAMPQKRNPGILNRCRTDSSTLLGLAVGEAFRAHNIPAGMADGRIRGTDTIVKKTTSVVNQLDRILQALDIRPERALEELNLDWTCSQEIADVMMRKHNIPFRSGHHFASEIVTYARARNITPVDFTYAHAQEVYRNVAAADASLPRELPLTAEELQEAKDPAGIIRNRAVKGGPQHGEMQIMFAEAQKVLNANIVWQKNAAGKVGNAETKLNNDFAKLLQEGSGQ